MKKILILFLSFVLASQMTFILSAQAFSDVSSGSKYTDAIEFLLSEGVVSGFSDGTFRPDSFLDRAMMLKILVEAANPTSSPQTAYMDTSCFPDVAAGVWYSPYVCYAKAHGLVKGYQNGKFHPEREVSLVEALKMTFTVFAIPYESTKSGEVWYKRVTEAGIMHRLVPASFSAFEQRVDRADMSEIVTRAMKFKNAQLDAWFADTGAAQAPTYDLLQKGSNILSKGFSALQGVPFSVNYLMGGTGVRAVLYSYNAKKNTTEGCVKNYFSGDFYLVFFEKGGKVNSRGVMPLGRLDIPSGGFFELDAIGSVGPFVGVQEFLSCDFNLYSLYGTNGVRVAFEGEKQNKFPARELSGVQFKRVGGLISVEVSYVDTLSGNHVGRTYVWGGNGFYLK